MATLGLLAIITAKEGKGAVVKEELLKLIPPTRAEAGCLKYELSADNKNPDRFVFIEEWETYDLWQDHMKSSHIAAHNKAVDGLTEPLQLFELTLIK
ncbi:MAG: hypothetical protein BEN19_04870 [Epulopiscium sp. Nuni2H_MBin003]|nr:MAG: hypothetical protein BEN19_04870 [Epulopiscium sp. Nuni2H_MBin003]